MTRQLTLDATCAHGSHPGRRCGSADINPHLPHREARCGCCGCRYSQQRGARCRLCEPHSLRDLPPGCWPASDLPAGGAA